MKGLKKGVWLPILLASLLVVGCSEEEDKGYDLGTSVSGDIGSAGVGTDDNVDNGVGSTDNTNDMVDGNDTETTTQALGGPIKGFVLSTDGAALNNAQVEVIGPDLNATLNTGELGEFIVEDVAFGEVELKVTLDGYATIRRSMEHTPDSAALTFEFVTKRASVVVLDAAEGGEVAVGDAKVSLPAGGYVSDETGEVVDGDLEVHITYYDANDPADLAAAPPLYRLMNDASGNMLISYGMVDVELFINGESVDLGPGQTAEIDLPVDGHAEALEGRDSVPAWWYDTKEGTWVREGEGAIVTVDGSLRWQATVSHFTTWNCDDPGYSQGCSSSNSYIGTCGTSTGVCTKGRWKCVDQGSTIYIYDGQGGESAICEGNYDGTSETCNRLDDDCNGKTDETFPEKNDACYTGSSATRGVGECKDGKTACDGSGPSIGGYLTCDGQVTPADEACDGLDGDCDGIDDRDDPDACPVGQSCFEGTDNKWSCETF